MDDVVVVEIFDSLDDLSRVVDDGWFIVFERTPLLTKQLREATCVYKIMYIRILIGGSYVHSPLMRRLSRDYEHVWKL